MRSSTKSVELSLIVPAYSCPTIDKDLQALLDFLKKNSANSELICVVDGLKSPSDPTLDLAKSVINPRLKVITYKQNQGKGFAVRTGFRHAKGGIIGFFDAGSDITLESLKTALATFTKLRPPLLIGNKYHPKSQLTYPLTRRILSFASHTLNQLLLGLNLSDTQCGLKLFSRPLINKVLPLLTIKGFAFDLEILSLSRRFGYWPPVEIPITLTYNYKSTVSTKSIFAFLLDFLYLLKKLYIN